MEGHTFDELLRATTQASTRRGALGLLAGAALSALAWFDQAEAKKGRKKRKRRKKKGGSATIPPTVPTVPPPAPPPPPPPPECIEDDDCGLNEVCQDGGCICPEVLKDRCVDRCSPSDDCANGCSCRALFPDDDQGRVVCVDDDGLCNNPQCADSDDCDPEDICVSADCGGFPTGRCFPVCNRLEE
jgi:hypothetical protein